MQSERTGIPSREVRRNTGPLDAVHPVLLIDAIVVKVRDAQVANRPVCVAIGTDLAAERDVLGLWLGTTGCEGAKQWVTMLTELRSRKPNRQGHAQDLHRPHRR